MGVIIVEGVLFVALIAAGGTLLYWIVILFTPAGIRIRQIQNRRRIDRAAELTCPIHGPHADHHLARLANGSRVCPECYKETFDA
jgi:hypothetical protein